MTDLKRQTARVNIFFSSDGHPSNCADDLHLNELRKIKFKTQLMLFCSVGGEAQKYLPQMKNIVSNRPSERHAYLEEAKEDL